MIGKLAERIGSVNFEFPLSLRLYQWLQTDLSAHPCVASRRNLLRAHGISPGLTLIR